ncbi:hypothetical protein WISP_87315 [Willisornis vidua]|uniref:Uncharacterized protein n=1 Tax=Willisornis vidua TaxID=1566151 RepID=A0ABQ9D3W5_9PASS|nr:hypothetical protein WISP_87315 [Willisornis vidua]
MGCQLFQEHVMGDSGKGFAEVQRDHIHSFSLIHQVGHLIIKGDQKQSWIEWTPAIRTTGQGGNRQKLMHRKLHLRKTSFCAGWGTKLDRLQVIGIKTGTGTLTGLGFITCKVLEYKY